MNVDYPSSSARPPRPPRAYTGAPGVPVDAREAELRRRHRCRCAGALLRAAVRGDLHLLARMATEVDAFGGVRSRCGRGALHLAAANGRTHVCRFLLESLGLPVDAISTSGETSLLLAATFGHTGTAAYLLDRGADPSMPDPDGEAPLHWAAYNGDAELAKLLLSRGADVGAANARGTALHVAAARAHPAVVSILLDHGANPNKIANCVFTPLVSSLCGGSLECMKLLIQGGANVNGAGFDGATPLLLACSRAGSIGFIKCLLDSGANPNIPDELNRSPIELAAIHAEREVVEVLYPLTNYSPLCPDWTVDGILKYVNSDAYKEWARNAASKRKDNLKLQGNLAFKSKDYDAAILLYSMAMKFDNSDADLYSNRSICWFHLGIGDEALLDAQSCSKMRPDWAKGYYRQGMAFCLLQDYASASDFLLRALKLDPGNATIVESASNFLLRALMMNPENAAIVESASDFVLRALRLDPGNAAIVKAACNFLLRALKMDPVNATIVQALRDALQDAMHAARSEFCGAFGTGSIRARKREHDQIRQVKGK